MSINVNNAELIDMRMALDDSAEAHRRQRAKALAAELAERLRGKELDRADAEAEVYDENGLP